MWYLSKLAIRNRAVTLLLTLLLIGASVWATFQLKMELLPAFDLPMMTVITVYPDASPEMVLDEVTVPVEGLISEQWKDRGLRHIYSTSAEQISVIFVDFEYGTGMDKVQASIREGIPGLNLPASVVGLPLVSPQVQENPHVLPINLDLMPLAVFSLSGNVPPDELRHIAETLVVPELESVDGVLLAEIEGGQNEQVIIAPDPAKLVEYGISMYQIAGLISLSPEYASLQDLAELTFGGPLVLEDIAEISVGPAPRTVITRENGVPNATISITKAREANTVDVARALMAKADEIRAELGEDMALGPVFNQGTYIERSINQLLQMAIIGGVLATIVVFFFLRAFRVSLVTAASIPVSVLIGFLGMKFSGVTINLFTLSAMAIAVGRLIDNSIVVSEVVYRRLQQGQDFREAVVRGAKEVATPITASTLATVAIFVPLLFVGGIVGELFLPFALTITYALLASLFIALIMIPAFSSHFVSRREVENEAKSARGDAWYQKAYVPSLKWALGHRAITLVITGALFLGSLGLLPIIGTSFMPSTSEKMLVMDIELPPGTSLSTTSVLASRIEELLKDVDQIELFATTVGSSSSLSGAVGTAMGAGDNTARILAKLTPDSDMDQERANLERLMSDNEIEGVSVSDMMGSSGMAQGMGSSQVEVTVSGDDLNTLSLAASMLYERLIEMKGLSSVESDATLMVPRLVIKQDPEKLAELGLTEEQTRQLEMELLFLRAGNSLPGVRSYVDGEPYGVYIGGLAAALYASPDPETLARGLTVGWPQTFSLQSIADIRLAPAQTHIGRVDQKRSINLSGIITEKNVGAVNRAVEKEIDEILSKPGMEDIEISTGGIAEEMQETFSSMGRAILGAIFIALLILVLTMRSVLNPVIVMVSLPLASIGAFLALLITGNTLGVSGLMGMLMLVGIVLTNAIVLIALVEQLRKGGMRVNDAIVEAGRTRLRPILMTALTTMIAMAPLAWGVGEGTIIAAELAVVVIGGLFSSTLLTLLVIPVIYSLIDNVRRRSARAS
ncbi:MAG: efflux RND transporter permease subunit [Dehalococcoidia bacterium]|nr:efflux RND transporter permease subunit [Dehalococcoidia bacterium]